MDWTSLLAILGGLALLVVGGEALVRGASAFAVARGVPPLVVGLTVVAMGTSAPEFAVSVAASSGGQADIALGNVVGSNILNVLLILGISAAVATIVVSRRVIWLEVPVMVGASLLVWALAADGAVSRGEGYLLAALLVAYVAMQLVLTRRELRRGRADPAAAALPPGAPGGLLSQVLLILVGLACLVAGSRFLVDGSVAVARALGVSELIVGLTIVAAGTSMPEVATSVIATLRGQREIAVGNVVGSNVFNLFGVLGMTAALSPSGVPVPTEALHFDIPILCATAFACLPIFLTGHRISRWEGWLFLAYYVAYVTFLVLAATRHDALPRFSVVLLEFVLPLTAATLGVGVWRHLRRRPGAP